jgi:two-component system sensor histidine kinase KdpD
VALTCLFGELFLNTLDPPTLSMFYLLPVVVSALRCGRGPTILASILSVALFDYFIVPPRFEFAMPQFQSQVAAFFALFGLLVVGLVISTLASKTKRQADEVRRRELQAEVLRETEKLQSTLLNSVSHDLRTPLVSIMGALGVLLQDPALREDGPRRELLENAHQEAKRLNRLVGNMLNMTRVESGKLRIHPEPCELPDVVGAALEQLKDKIENRDIRVLMPKNLPEVPMDPILMTGVFVNLIDNALKFSPSDAPVEIKAEALHGDAVSIEISDKGIGIPETDLEMVFDKFYRALHPKRVNGTGLGLSICKGIVAAHGGFVSARNNPDKGSTLTLLLPLKRQAPVGKMAP